jgi:hypothetical protein
MTGFSMALPFVVCKSNNGPYDDDAFVAGVSYGHHWSVIAATKPERWSEYVRPAMVPQYDLLAMDEGYVMFVEPWDEHPNDWHRITLKRIKT